MRRACSAVRKQTCLGRWCLCELLKGKCIYKSKLSDPVPFHIYLSFWLERKSHQRINFSQHWLHFLPLPHKSFGNKRLKITSCTDVFSQYINTYPHLRSTKLISELSLSCQIPLKPKNSQQSLCSPSLFTESLLLLNNKTSQYLQQSPTAFLGNNQFHFHPAHPSPPTTCEHAASCQGLNLGFSGSKTGEERERGARRACPGQQLVGGHRAGAEISGALQQPTEQQRKSFCDFRQALVWRQLSQIISAQSAQASCLPIGEPLVSRHLKIIIIGQTIITGTTVTSCWCLNLVLCSTMEKDSGSHHSIQAFLSLCLS